MRLVSGPVAGLIAGSPVVVRVRRRVQTIALACAVLFGGGETRRASGHAPPPPISFDSVFVLVERIPLRVTDASPIGEVTNLVRWNNGFAVADQLERNVKVFDASGRLRVTIGRAGSGPGEFRRPTYLFVVDSNRLGVFDAGLTRIQLFDTLGRLHGQPYVLGRAVESASFEPTRKRLVLGGSYADPKSSDPRAARVMDLTGGSEYLLGRARQLRVPYFANFRQTIVAALEQGVVIGDATTDTLEFVTYDGRTTRRVAAAPDIYHAPDWTSLQPRAGAELTALSAWGNRQTWLQGVVAVEHDWLVAVFTTPVAGNDRGFRYGVLADGRHVVSTLPTTVRVVAAAGSNVICRVEEDDGYVLQVRRLRAMPARGSGERK